MHTTKERLQKLAGILKEAEDPKLAAFKQWEAAFDQIFHDYSLNLDAVDVNLINQLGQAISNSLKQKQQQQQTAPPAQQQQTPPAGQTPQQQ